MTADNARVRVTAGCHLNGRRQRHGCRARPSERDFSGLVAEELQRRRRRRSVVVHASGSVHHWFGAVLRHRCDHRRQRARLHRRVPGPQVAQAVQLSARVAGRVRPVRGHTGHADGASVPGAGQMAVRHVHVRPLGEYR